MIVYHLYKLLKDNLPFWLRYRFYRDHLGSFTEQQILCYHESCLQREWLLQERWEKNLDSNKLFIFCLMVLQHTTTSDFKLIVFWPTPQYFYYKTKENKIKMDWEDNPRYSRSQTQSTLVFLGAFLSDSAKQHCSFQKNTRPV